MLILAFSLLCAFVFDWWWERRAGSPNKAHARDYFLVAKHEPAPIPFCWRWLVPALCGTDPLKWKKYNRVALAATFPALANLALLWGLSPVQISAALVLWGLVPSIHQYPRRYIVVADPIAMLFVLFAGSSALLYAKTGMAFHLLLFIADCLLAGAARESAPVFIAAGTLNPLALIGLLGVGWWRKSCPAPPDIAHLSGSPLKMFRTHGLTKLTRGFEADWFWKIGPAAIALISLDPRAYAASLVGVAEMLVASDKIRLLLHGLPFLLLPAVAVTPVALLPLLLYFGLACSNHWEA